MQAVGLVTDDLINQDTGLYNSNLMKARIQEGYNTYGSANAI
jgi:hypothetical protein